MRKTILLIAVIAMGLLIQSCSKYKDNFHTMFPNATNENWSRHDGYKLVTFLENGYNMTAWFDENDNWYMTNTNILYHELPNAVRTAFEASEWASWAIEEVEKIDRLNMESVYTIEVENDATDEEYVIAYLEDGTVTGGI